VLGPQHDHFRDESLTRFLTQTYTVAATSDRIGCRLQGEPLRHLASAEIVSDGMLPGAIQIPADGQPIVMMADAPTTGGYPKIAAVATVDLPLLAQLLPGEGRVRFAAISVEEAQDLLRAAAAG
jgi:allophanate hydrolase